MFNAALRLAKRPSLPFAEAAINEIEGKRFGRPLANKIEGIRKREVGDPGRI
jgi:hypothetical protein